MYTKQTWADGDVLLASKLNHIEDGIEAIQLPEVTALDAGGFLTVVEDTENTEDVIVIPQQTVTWSTGSAVDVTDNFQGYPSNNCPATITVNGTDYDATFDRYGDGNNPLMYTTDSDTLYSFAVPAPKGTKLASASWQFSANYNGSLVYGTYTVKCTLQIPMAKWGITFDDGGGDISFS